MKVQNGAYAVYNLNWVVTVDNRSEVTSQIDQYSANSKTIGDALALLKALFVGEQAEMLMVSTTKLLPLKDYVLSRFDSQLHSALQDHLSKIVDEEQFIRILKHNTMIFNDESLTYFDLVMPSRLTLEQRNQSGPEFYVLPIKMVTSDLSEQTISTLAALFQQESEIKNIVAAFKSTELFQELSARSNQSLSITPLIGDQALSSLRGIVTHIRRIQGAKNGKSY